MATKKISAKAPLAPTTTVAPRTEKDAGWVKIPRDLLLAAVRFGQVLTILESKFIQSKEVTKNLQRAQSTLSLFVQDAVQTGMTFALLAVLTKAGSMQLWNGLCASQIRFNYLTREEQIDLNLGLERLFADIPRPLGGVPDIAKGFARLIRNVDVDESSLADFINMSSYSEATQKLIQQVFAVKQSKLGMGLVPTHLQEFCVDEKVKAQKLSDFLVETRIGQFKALPTGIAALTNVLDSSNLNVRREMNNKAHTAIVKTQFLITEGSTLEGAAKAFLARQIVELKKLKVSLELEAETVRERLQAAEQKKVAAALKALPKDVLKVLQRNPELFKSLGV